MENTTIKIEKFQNIINMYFNFLKSAGIDSIIIEHDFYHHINEDTKYIDDDLKEPEVLTGHLGDDWDFIKNDLESPIEDIVPINLAFHVAPLLEYIGWRASNMK